MGCGVIGTGNLPGTTEYVDPDARPTNGANGETPGYGAPGGGSQSADAEGGPYANSGGDYTSGGTGSSNTSTFDPANSPPGNCTRLELGKVSERHESNGNPAAIGHDRTGGWSYGTYQIATLTGTFNRFMSYLESRFPDIHSTLTSAGGTEAARGGNPRFKDTWESLASNSDFRKCQHDFIQASHHDIAVESIKNRYNFDVCSRCNGLQDMIWSASVQHGPAGCTNIFERALQNTGKTIDQLTDVEIIRAFYAERKRVDVYFRRSTAAVQQSVRNRFDREEQDCLAICQEVQGSQAPVNSGRV